MVVHTAQHIEERLGVIQDCLEAKYDSDEGSTIVDRISTISAYMAESGKLLGDAKYHLQSKMQSELMNLVKNLLPEYASSTLQNSFVKALCKDESKLVNIADRINASCVHQLDAMRSQLSYIKSLTNF